MPYYNTPEAAAKFLSDFTLRIDRQEKGTLSPANVKYSVTLSKGGKEFHTSFESNPEVHGEPTVTQVFSALADGTLTLLSYSLDEFVDESCEGGMKPSAAVRTYESYKKTNLWMQDELHLSGSEIEELRQTLDENEVEVNELVEKAASERTAAYEHDHPKVPASFVTIEELQADLDLGDFGDQVEDYDGDLTDAMQEVADSNVDIYYGKILAWLPDHAEWLEEAAVQGLLEGCKGDIYKMIQAAQYECFSQDLYDHREDICKNVTLSQLASEGVYAIRTDVADAIGDLDFEGDATPADEARGCIIDAVQADLDERYGDDLAEAVADYMRDNDDVAGRVNPVAMSAETVRAVNEKGYDAVFAEQWRDELSEHGIDPDGRAAQAEERPTLSSMDRQCRDLASALSSDGDGREPARSETEH